MVVYVYMTFDLVGIVARFKSFHNLTLFCRKRGLQVGNSRLFEVHVWIKSGKEGITTDGREQNLQPLTKQTISWSYVPFETPFCPGSNLSELRARSL